MAPDAKSAGKKAGEKKPNKAQKRKKVTKNPAHKKMKPKPLI